MNDQILIDYQERPVRLTQERWLHILQHPEIVDQRERLIETLRTPQIIIATVADENVHAYHRLYAETPVTRKYLIVVVKFIEDDAFVLTAYFSNRLKRGRIVWQATP